MRLQCEKTLGEEVGDVAHGGLVRTAQGVERQRVELDVVVRADVRVALDVGLVDALQARRRGRIQSESINFDLLTRFARAHSSFTPPLWERAALILSTSALVLHATDLPPRPT